MDTHLLDLFKDAYRSKMAISLEMERGVLFNYNLGVEQKQALPVEGEKDCTSRVGPMGSRDGIGSTYVDMVRFLRREFTLRGQRISLRMKDFCSEVTSLRSFETDSKKSSRVT